MGEGVIRTLDSDCNVKLVNVNCKEVPNFQTNYK